LVHFGSIDKIKEASVDELLAVRGITVDLAQALKAHLE
jgi:excinuclease UvrABC nuclease subunit